jgi:hypothetical protein
MDYHNDWIAAMFDFTSVEASTTLGEMSDFSSVENHEERQYLKRINNLRRKKIVCVKTVSNSKIQNMFHLLEGDHVKSKKIIYKGVRILKYKLENSIFESSNGARES